MLDQVQTLEQLGKKIQKTRKELGYRRREDFARKYGFSPKFIAKIEKGKVPPPAKLIIPLCKELGVPERGFLYGNFNDLRFRANKQLNIHDSAIIETLADNIKLLIEKKKAHYNRFDFQGNYNPAETAREFICHYNLNEYDFNTYEVLFAVLASRDIFIFAYPLKASSAVVHIGDPFFVVLNSNEPNDRWSFSLLHEIGHFIAPGNLDKKDEERYSDVFAGHVLIPEKFVGVLWKELNHLIRNYNFESIFTYVRKRTSLVSPEAVMTRLLDVYNYDKRIFGKWRKFAKERREKEGITKEKVFRVPQEYIKKSIELYRENKISFNRLNEMFLNLASDKMIQKWLKKF